MKIKPWKERKCVKKGDIGEKLVDKYLRSKQLIPYSPDSEYPHPFDRLVASRDKQTLMIIDVKTKAARNSYPDTGMNKSHYDEYMRISIKHNIPVYVFFCDEMLGKVYGNYLSELIKPTKIKVKNKIINYPLVQGDIIYFPLSLMIDVCNIESDQIVAMKSLSARSHVYDDEF